MKIKWYEVLFLVLIVVYDVAIIHVWNAWPAWNPRPPEGYVWEHTLDEWAQITAEKEKPKPHWVYGWVNRYDPKTGRRWEEQAWIIEPWQN